MILKLLCILAIVCQISRAFHLSSNPSLNHHVKENLPKSQNSLSTNELSNGLYIHEHNLMTEQHDDMNDMNGAVLQENDDTSEIASFASEDDSEVIRDEVAAKVPPYMIDLYRRFSENKFEYPSASIVRSFINQENPRNFERELPEETSTDNSGNEVGNFVERSAVIHYNITFNLTIPFHEHIVMSELRLFVVNGATDYDHRALVKFTLFHLGGVAATKVMTHYVYREGSDWEVFDVSEFVKHTVKRHRSTDISGSLSVSIRLQVRIEDAFDGSRFEAVDIDISRHVNYEPLLVVHSDDDSTRSKKQEKQNEMEEILEREMMTNVVALDSYGMISSAMSSVADDVFGIEKTRQKRALRRNFCRRREMKVNFEDIGWSNWIIFPQEYHAYRCEGKCYFPLTAHWTPTKHAIVQTLMHDNDLTVERACCVPTKLDSISVLYLDEVDVPTYKYAYDGMVVNECGCR